MTLVTIVYIWTTETRKMEMSSDRSPWICYCRASCR